MAERNGNKSIDLPSDPSFVISGDASDQRRRKDSPVVPPSSVCGKEIADDSQHLQGLCNL